MFQSPSLRGSGRFAETRRPGRRRGTIVSIPFIAGQWSLPSRRRHARRMAGVFQSPSLRGSGRFEEGGNMNIEVGMFQSPSLRGSGRFRSDFLSWLTTTVGFNPLHCGAVVASCGNMSLRGVPDMFQSPSLRGSGRFKHGRGRRRRGARVSIPFIAGQWSLRSGDPPGGDAPRRVSIPFIAGQWSLLPRTTPLSFCRVLLRNTRPDCDHVLCARLHVWPKPVIIP